MEVVNKSPSQRLTTFIDTIKHEAIPHSVLIHDLEVMRDQFQKEEAAAYRHWQAVSEYYGVEVINQLIEKSNELTGR